MHSKKSSENAFETDENETDKPKERYISPERRQQIINELRLVQYINKIKYRKNINLLDHTSNQPSKFRTKNWVKINDNRNGVYDEKYLKIKTITLYASLCDYSDVYIFVEGRITVLRQGADDAANAGDGNNKEVVFKDEPDDNITDSKSFKFKSRITNNIDGIAEVKIVVSLKYLSNFGELLKAINKLWSNTWFKLVRKLSYLRSK